MRKTMRIDETREEDEERYLAKEREADNDEYSEEKSNTDRGGKGIKDNGEDDEQR